MRRREPLDPVAERDLALLDAAVAGAPDADPELARLVRDVRAEVPRPAPAFRAALDARVAAGFPPAPPSAARPAARPRRLRAALRPRFLVPALGVVAAALLALAVVALPLGGSGDQAASGPAVGAGEAGGAGAGSRPGGSADSAAAKAAPPVATDQAAPSASPAPPALAAPTTVAPAAPGRKVERTITVDLGTPAGRFDDVTDRVVRTTQRAGGFVADSRIRRSGSRGTATFVLRIPSARLDAAIADLSRLAHVRSIEQGATDLTGATDGTAARLRDTQTRRRALVAALATASGARAARLRGRLADTRARERSLDRALRALRARTAYATVELTVTATRAQAAAPPPHDRFTPGAALRDAGRALEVAAGVAILALAVAVPLALLGGVGLATAGALRRRRREAALDVV
jgi:hypothetical protein